MNWYFSYNNIQVNCLLRNIIWEELDGDVEEKVDYSKKQWTLWMQSTGL